MVDDNRLPAASRFFDGKLYQRMHDDLHLAGMSKRTVHGYLRAVRQLVDYCQRRPNEITESQRHRCTARHGAYSSRQGSQRSLRSPAPVQVRSVLRDSQRKAYGAMFDAGSQTILDLAAGLKYLSGCRIGFWGMLHTWGRDPMVYHPHVQFVVPGGGVREDGSRWQQTPTNFLFPHAAMVTVYKAKLADQLRECRLYEEIPTDAWHAKFVVDIKPVGDGQAVLNYQLSIA